MMTAVDLTEAAMALREQFGPRLAASRLGGRERLAAALRAQFALDTNDAERIVAALVRCQAIMWEPEPGLPRPCPGVLELCGDWLIRPERVQAGEQAVTCGAAYVSA
ncbi:MAG TPA: hypothetical protein VFU22_33670 [Roseiflexaceae bacterium]|nr:hypothetical protein [Roseiflexaceae bacterium]